MPTIAWNMRRWGLCLSVRTFPPAAGCRAFRAAPWGTDRVSLGIEPLRCPVRHPCAGLLQVTRAPFGMGGRFRVSPGQGLWGEMPAPVQS